MSQEKVWDDIAPQWNEFRKEPGKLMKTFLKKQKGKILDLGCGSGRHLLKLKNIKMYEVDFSEKMLELGKQKAKKKKIDAEFIKADTTQIPFEDNYFDAAMYIATLHCLVAARKRNKSLRELLRVLKPKAKAYLAVFDFNSKRFGKKKERIMKWKDKGTRYYYFYTEKELQKILEKIGFKIISTHHSEKTLGFFIEKPAQ